MDLRDQQSEKRSRRDDPHCSGEGGRDPEMGEDVEPLVEKADLAMQTWPDCWTAEDVVVNTVHSVSACQSWPLHSEGKPALSGGG